VSVQVELYTATEAHGPVFHQFEKGTAESRDGVSSAERG
jgi:hypothetical protein